MHAAVTPSIGRQRAPSRVREHPLVAYFALAFGVTWLCEVILFAVLHLPLLPWLIPAVFGPALAAFLVTGATEGRPGVRDLWRRCIRWRVGARWYLLVLVAVPALLLLSFVFLPGGTSRLHGGPLTVGLTYLAQFVVIFFLGGGQEEPGWRGFALPRLQERFGALVGSVLLGALWGLWHLPLFLFVPGYDNAGSGVAGIATTFAVFCLFTIGLSAIMTWFLNHTGGSVLMAMLLHAAVNATFAFAPATHLTTARMALWVAALALALIVATRGRLGDDRRAASVRR